MPLPTSPCVFNLHSSCGSWTKNGPDMLLYLNATKEYTPNYSLDVDKVTFSVEQLKNRLNKRPRYLEVQQQLEDRVTHFFL